MLGSNLLSVKPTFVIVGVEVSATAVTANFHDIPDAGEGNGKVRDAPSQGASHPLFTGFPVRRGSFYDFAHAQYNTLLTTNCQGIIMGNMENVRVELYQDSSGTFHYEFREFKVPRSRLTPCGLNTKELRHAAWFEVGDHRGRHHYGGACEVCSSALVV